MRSLGFIFFALASAACTGSDAAPPRSERPSWLAWAGTTSWHGARVIHRGGLVMELPERGDAPLTITHSASGVSARVALIDGPNGPMVRAGDVAHYVDERVELALVPRRDGIEDYVWVHAGAALHYRLEPSAAGLRLVGGVLELLDESGAPRLRAARSWLLDRRGEWRQARIEVDDCEVDRDPRGPWDRRPTPPAASCTVRVTWDPRGLSYPLMVDPFWSNTESMATRRFDHVAALLSDGRVLVAGGRTDLIFDPPTLTAELYDPTTLTWAATDSLNVERATPAWTLLDDGAVLVSGGDMNGTAEIYRDGVFSPTGSQAGPRDVAHTLTTLNDGSVVAIGGDVDDVIERYDPVGGSWAVVGNLAHGRGGHSATLLADGRVLIAGGWNGDEQIPSTEIFDPANDQTREVDDLDTPRSLHGAVRLSDERVMVIGGAQGGASLEIGINNCELFDPVSETWSQGPDLGDRRYAPVTALLPSGAVLVAGGSPTSEPLSSHASAEVWSGEAWTPAGMLSVPRSFARATAMSSGVLVTGGWNMNDGVEPILASAEVFTPLALGEPCGAAGECLSGHCADGVCCDDACGGCMGCTNALKNGGEDGVCGPIEGSDPHDVCADECGPQACVDGACAPIGDVDVGSCDGYACVDGHCLDSCASVDDCAQGFVCNSDRLCIEPPPAAVDGGCGCQLSQRHPGRAWPWLALLSWLSIRVRRARRRGCDRSAGDRSPGRPMLSRCL